MVGEGPSLLPSNRESLVAGLELGNVEHPAVQRPRLGRPAARVTAPDAVAIELVGCARPLGSGLAVVTDGVRIALRSQRRVPVRGARLARLSAPFTFEAMGEGVVEASGDDGDPDLLAHILVDAGAEDDLGLRVRGGLDDLGCLAPPDQRQSRPAGDGKQQRVRTDYWFLEQRV